MLVFATTHPTGFRVMTDIMANAGHVNDEGFPDCTHYSNPPPKTQLFYPAIDELKKDLCSKCAGKMMTMLDIFLDHRQYPAGNYKDILNELEDEQEHHGRPSGQ
jgi:hypothetical protein